MRAFFVCGPGYPRSGPVQAENDLLVFFLDRDDAHGGPGDGFADGSRVGGVVLAAFAAHPVPEMTRSQYAIRALDWIFERPIFKSSDFVESAGIPAPTARRFLGVLQTGAVLLAPGSGRRAAVLAFPALLNIAEGREVL